MSFTNNGVTIGTGTLSNGTASFTTSSLSNGTHPIHAVYSGDTNYSVSQSSTLYYRVR